MKNKKFLTGLIIFCLVVFSVACTSKTNSQFVGTWKAVREENGGKIVESYESLSENELMHITFDKDGTVLVELYGQTINGKWKEKDGGVEMTSNSQVNMFWPENDEIYIINNDSGNKMYFKKQ